MATAVVLSISTTINYIVTYIILIILTINILETIWKEMIKIAVII